MTLVIRDYTSPNEVARLDGMLWLPFRAEIKDSAINRRNYSEAAAR